MKNIRNDWKNINELKQAIDKQKSTNKTKTMKKIAFLIMVLLAVPQLNAQGISFEHGTFAAALAKAKAENKLLFMDCYTTWCGPCKMMSKDVFTQKEVGDYMNASFVSIKVDMEKGEGIELAKQYNVKAFPTLLFMDASGKVVHNVVGGLKTTEFIDAAKIAFDPTKQISYYENKYKEGNRDIAMVTQYVKALYAAYKKDEVEKIGKSFIPTMTENQYLTEDGFTIMAYAGIDYNSKPYNYLVKNKAAFIAKQGIGQESYDYLVQSTISNYLNQIASTKTLDELNTAIKATQSHLGSAEQQEQTANNLRGQYYLAQKQYDMWFALNKEQADKEFKKDPKTSLSYYINTAYRIAVDPTLSNAGLYPKAIEMIENIKNTDPDFIAANYCLASLYLKTKNKSKALENINSFIEKNTAIGGESDSRLLKLKSDIESL